MARGVITKNYLALIWSTDEFKTTKFFRVHSMSGEVVGFKACLVKLWGSQYVGSEFQRQTRLYALLH